MALRSGAMAVATAYPWRTGSVTTTRKSTSLLATSLATPSKSCLGSSANRSPPPLSVVEDDDGGSGFGLQERDAFFQSPGKKRRSFMEGQLPPLLLSSSAASAARLHAVSIDVAAFVMTTAAAATNTRPHFSPSRRLPLSSFAVKVAPATVLHHRRSRPSSAATATTGTANLRSSSIFLRSPCLLMTSSSPAALRSVRCYANFGGGWGLQKVQHTKYRISKPWTTDSRFDDILLSEPSRDDFVRHSKDIPIFLRFLKLVTDVEKRPTAFVEFARRCESGLVVEKDVFIMKKELIDCAWRNGYSEAELNAFEIAFPSDYQFHYPELAVLFDVSEEDAYQFCIRRRAAKPEELVELKYKPPPNLVASYALAFLGVWFGLSNTVLSNAWFYSKTFPFAAVFYLLGSHFYRDIREYFWKTERALVQTAREKKEEGEDLICQQISKYSNDSRCLDFLSAFKDEVQQQLSRYRRALISSHKAKATERMLGRLVAVQKAERQMQSSLQELMVKEVVSSFRSDFATNDGMKAEALRNAIQGIAGRDSKDIVAEHFKLSSQQLREVDFSEATDSAKHSPVAQRLSAAFQIQQAAFLDQFTVRPEEASEVRLLTGKCRRAEGSSAEGGAAVYDFSKLSTAEQQRLDSLCFALSGRMGFEPMDESALAAIPSPVFEAAAAAAGGGEGMEEKAKMGDGDSTTAAATAAFVDEINSQLRAAAAKLRHARLTAFARAFE